MSTNGRIDERVPILRELQAEIMVSQPMMLKEISRGGLTVECRMPLHLNSLYDLRFVLDGKPVVARARVAHSRISDVDRDIVTYRTGLQFVELSDRARASVEDFLITLKTGRGRGRAIS